MQEERNVLQFKKHDEEPQRRPPSRRQRRKDEQRNAVLGEHRALFHSQVSRLFSTGTIMGDEPSLLAHLQTRVNEAQTLEDIQACFAGLHSFALSKHEERRTVGTSMVLGKIFGPYLTSPHRAAGTEE